MTPLTYYLAPVLLGVSGWVSLNPYFLWGKWPWALLISAFAATAGVLAALNAAFRPKFHGAEASGVALLTVFIVYITVQPRMDGGHSKWVMVLPALWAIFIFSNTLRERCFLVFVSLFIITIIPGMLVWLWVVAGLPITFSYLPADSPNSSVMSVLFLHLPGVLFTESNSIVLPWGGVLFRLNAMYDEPGLVGTIAALALAAFRFRLRDWRGAILYGAGLMSFSLAFIALTTFGFIGRAMLTRKLTPLGAIVPLLVAALLLLGYIHVETPAGTHSSIAVEMTGLTADEMKEITGDLEVLIATPRHSKLRQSDSIDNRALPKMKRLLREYWSSDIKTILFGIASDASVVRDPASQIWTRHLTNHGLVGFGILMAGFLCIAWARWQYSSQSPWVFLFLALLSVSSYQRPVIWMPYMLLLLLCGSVASAQNLSRVSRVVPERLAVKESAHAVP